MTSLARSAPSDDQAIVAHVARVAADVPGYRDVDSTVWIAVIEDWRRPLQASRAWRLRHGEEQVRRARTAWADRDADGFEDLKRAVAGQLDAARAAWTHLDELGFVGRDRDDLVTTTLRDAIEAA